MKALIVALLMSVSVVAAQTGGGGGPAGGGGGGSGTVTSVTVTVPVPLTGTNCTITTAGTCALTWTTGETANEFLATPNGSPGAVGLRAIVAADIPSLSSTYCALTGCSVAGLTATGSFTATGLVTNNDLVNASITVNGQTCTLGSTCTVAAGTGSALTRTNYTVAGGRACGSTYQNTSTFPLIVAMTDGASTGTVAVTDASATPSAQVWSMNMLGSGNNAGSVFLVMPSNYYKVTCATVLYWNEYLFTRGTITSSGDLNASRVKGTVYQNTTGGMMLVNVVLSGGASGDGILVTTDSVSTPTTVKYNQTTSVSTLSAFFIVPNGNYYKVTTTGSATVSHWYEYSSSLSDTQSINLFASPAQASFGGATNGARSRLNPLTTPKMLSIVLTSGVGGGTNQFASDYNFPPVFAGGGVWANACNSGKAQTVLAMNMYGEDAEGYKDNDTGPTQTSWIEDTIQ